MNKSTANTQQTKKSKLLAIAAIAIILISTWLIYRDTTTPPVFSADQFRNVGLQSALETIARATVAGGAPGAIVLVRKNGQEYVASAGVADKRSQRAMPTTAPLRIGSISKVYTAAIILELANQAKLQLDDPISKYLPTQVVEGLENANTATIRQLLQHTSGIPDYYDLRSYLFQDWTQAITLERTLPVAKRGASNFSAGEKFEYSNMGYVLLGAIAEQASGLSFSVLIDQMIRQPLGLSDTYYNIKHPNESSIHGYGTYFRPWADTYDWWEHSGPDGGIMATASETARFLEALTLDKGALSAVGAQMLQNTLPSEGNQQQGLGLQTIIAKDSSVIIGHTGDVFGYQTVAFSSPAHNAVFVAQVNCDCTALTLSMLRNTYQAIKAIL